MRSLRVAALGILLLVVPVFAHAFPFGGRASVVLQCVYNSTIYTNLGPPRGGEYIWTTATKTYQFGPPAYAGQWLLGLAGAPYYCIYRVSPLVIYTGIAMTMLGSSGAAAPPAPLTTGPSSGVPSGGGGSPAPTPTPTTPAGKVLISEVYYSVDVPHGSKPTGEWVELYNGTQSAVSLAGWKIEDLLSADVIPGNVIMAPRTFLVVSAASSTRDLWNLPSTVQFASLGNPIGNGLSNSGDRIIVRNAQGVIIDAASWGSDTTVFNPSALVVPYGNSMTRMTLSSDTDTANDWVARSPSPGN